MREISLIFFRLGFLGFGGPIAVMAMLEEEISWKRKWISAEHFSEALAICKLLPGPVATQLVIYLAYLRKGVIGGLLGGVVFVFPSFVLVLALSYLYLHFHFTQSASSWLAGMQASALVVILISSIQLFKPYRSVVRAWVIAIVAGMITAVKPGLEPLTILSAGALGVLFAKVPSTAAGSSAPEEVHEAGPKRLRLFIPLALGMAGAGREITSGLLARLFWVCFKAGAFTFGTGLAVVPVLEADVVSRYGWLSHSEFMAGLAIGQITPGPVTITSTFIGYKTAGMIGALVATTGMFLPAFFNVLVLVPRVWKRFSGTPAAKGFSSWAIPAVVGGILGTTIKLGVITLTSPALVGTFLVALGVAIWLKPPAWLLIPGFGILTGVLYRIF